MRGQSWQTFLSNSIDCLHNCSYVAKHTVNQIIDLTIFTYFYGKSHKSFVDAYGSVKVCLDSPFLLPTPSVVHTTTATATLSPTRDAKASPKAAADASANVFFFLLILLTFQVKKVYFLSGYVFSLATPRERLDLYPFCGNGKAIYLEMEEEEKKKKKLSLIRERKRNTLSSPPLSDTHSTV